MKLFTIILLTLICLSGIVHAQTYAGACAGLNIANVAGDTGPLDSDAKLGLNVGALVQFQLPANLIFQSALLYSQKGYKLSRKYNTTDENGVITGEITFDYTVSFNYMELPLLVKYNIPVAKTNYVVQPYLGTSIGFVASGRIKEDMHLEPNTSDIKERMNDTDVGLTIGVDAVYATNFLVGLQYEHGLTDIFKDTYPGNIKNSVFMLNFGYIVPLEH